jgi:hypothetical protein
MVLEGGRIVVLWLDRGPEFVLVETRRIIEEFQC